MKIVQIRALRGPNIFAHVPMVRMDLDLEELTDRETKEFSGFNDRLVASLPNLRTHRCSRRRPGGFLERLAEGTYFGHVVEHVAIELSSVAGIPVSYGKSVYAGRPGFYHIAVEYKSEQGMIFLLRSAVDLVTTLLNGKSYPTEEKALEARSVAERAALEPGASAIVKAACDRGIPCVEMDSRSLVQLGYGKYRRLFRAATTDQTNVIGVDVVSDKQFTKELADRGSIPVPHSVGLDGEKNLLFSTSGGKLRQIGRAIVDLLFPSGMTGRIPIVAITGTIGKTTVARMIAHILEHAGQRVGLTSTDSISNGGEEVVRGDLTGFTSARKILSDPSVDAAVLETARGGIMHSGLAYDWSDVGIVTNVLPDEIGQDGIESVDDLVHIQALVAERVRSGGTVVLNFDDARVAAIAHLPRVRGGGRTIAYFSLRGMTGELAKHVQRGGTAYYYEGEQIIEERRDEGRHVVTGVLDIPASAGDMLEHRVANAMAAIAAARALGLSCQQIAGGL